MKVFAASKSAYFFDFEVQVCTIVMRRGTIVGCPPTILLRTRLSKLLPRSLGTLPLKVVARSTLRLDCASAKSHTT